MFKSIDYGYKLVFINIYNGPFIKCDNNFFDNILPNAKNHDNNEQMIVFKTFKNIISSMINFIHYDMNLCTFT